MAIFDIIGPIMIGPSSSHTAGACRLGLVARRILESEPVKADIFLSGSFARTYKGHGTDRAILAGILGFKPDDVRLRDSREIAHERGLEFNFIMQDIDDLHPNSARIVLISAEGNKADIVGSSIGGGSVTISEVNGLKVKFDASSPTFIVVHYDRKGTVSKITGVISSFGMNIATLELTRSKKGGSAIMCLTIDGEVDPRINEEIEKIENVISSTLINPVV